MIEVSEEKNLEPRVKSNIINLYTFDSLEQIIKKLINHDLNYFTEKYAVQLEELQNKSYKIIRNIDDRVLYIMKKENKVEGSSTELFITILENEFFSKDYKYEELFHKEFLNNLDYYFNSRKIYGLNFFEGEISEAIEEVFLELTKKFKNPNDRSFQNKLITSNIKIDDNYCYFQKSNVGISIYEKIGIQDRTNKRGSKAIFVRYYFDLKNNYFEISYNDSAIKDLSSTENRKYILLDVKLKDENNLTNKAVVLSKKFGSETATLRTLQSRMKKLLNKNIHILSLNSGVSTKFNSHINDKDFKIPNHLKQFYESPYEGVMYQYFKENREHIISKYLNNDITKKLKLINETSNEVLKNNYSEEVNKSVKFLNYLIVFSELKSSKLKGKLVEDHIYSFTVRDHEVTKTTTKNSRRLPVYTTDFYWHLQEVADTIKQLSELGIYKTVELSNNKIVSQEVKISYLNDHLHFVYYQKSKNKNDEDAIKISEARGFVHESIKNEFRRIISKEI